MATSPRQRTARRRDYSDGLTPKQTLALRALLRGATVGEAAKRAGVRRGTVSYWRHHDYLFRAMLADAEHEVMASAVNRLKVEFAASLEFIAKFRDDKSNVAADRLRAATTLAQLVPISAEMAKPRELDRGQHDIVNLIASEGRYDAAADRKQHRATALIEFERLYAARVKGLTVLVQSCAEQRTILERQLAEVEAGLATNGAPKQAEGLKARAEKLKHDLAHIDGKMEVLNGELSIIQREYDQLDELASLDPLELPALIQWQDNMIRALGKKAYMELLERGEPTESLIRIIRQAKAIADREGIEAKPKPRSLDEVCAENGW